MQNFGCLLVWYIVRQTTYAVAVCIANAFRALLLPVSAKHAATVATQGSVSILYATKQNAETLLISASGGKSICNAERIDSFAESPLIVATVNCQPKPSASKPIGVIIGAISFHTVAKMLCSDGTKFSAKSKLLVSQIASEAAKTVEPALDKKSFARSAICLVTLFADGKR